MIDINGLVSSCIVRALAFSFRLHRFGNNLKPYPTGYHLRIANYVSTPILESGQADGRVASTTKLRTRQNGWRAHQAHLHQFKSKSPAVSGPRSICMTPAALKEERYRNEKRHHRVYWMPSESTDGGSYQSDTDHQF